MKHACDGCGKPRRADEVGAVLAVGRWRQDEDELTNDMTGQEWDLCADCMRSVVLAVTSRRRSGR